MTLRQRLGIELEDGTTFETVYDGRDLRAWETKHAKSAFIERTSVSMYTWLAWSAAKRDGTLNGQFDRYEAFDKVCVDVDLGLPLNRPDAGAPDGDAEEPPDPTEPSSDTPSSPSDG